METDILKAVECDEFGPMNIAAEDTLDSEAAKVALAPMAVMNEDTLVIPSEENVAAVLEDYLCSIDALDSNVAANVGVAPLVSPPLVLTKVKIPKYGAETASNFLRPEEGMVGRTKGATKDALWPTKEAPSIWMEDIGLMKEAMKEALLPEAPSIWMAPRSEAEQRGSWKQTFFVEGPYGLMMDPWPDFSRGKSVKNFVSGLPSSCKDLVCFRQPGSEDILCDVRPPKLPWHTTPETIART